MVAVVLAVAIVAVILATGLILAGHAKGTVAAPSHVTSGSESPPAGQTPGQRPGHPRWQLRLRSHLRLVLRRSSTRVR